jgi:adenylate cyclase
VTTNDNTASEANADKGSVALGPDAFSPENADSEQSDAITVVRRLIREAWAPDAQSRLYERVLAPLGSGEVGSEIWAQRLEDSDLPEFDREVTALRRELEDKAVALIEEKVSGEKREEHIRDLEQVVAQLNEKHSVSYLLSRLGDSGQKLLLESDDFRKQFLNGVPHLAYVVSVDIRRSTELMLKAREPQLFAAFIRDLADNLRRIVIENSGVFDKFTGDGILAVFPEFYSGPNAGHLALKTAAECHRAFSECYKRNRATFVSVLLNVGLGIGVDFGRVIMLQVGEDFTIVGTPVVYACRMAGAIAGRTFLNQPAYEELSDKLSDHFTFEETDIEIKNEGPTLAYMVEPAMHVMRNSGD